MFILFLNALNLLFLVPISYDLLRFRCSLFYALLHSSVKNKHMHVCYIKDDTTEKDYTENPTQNGIQTLV